MSALSVELFIMTSRLARNAPQQASILAPRGQHTRKQASLASAASVRSVYAAPFVCSARVGGVFGRDDRQGRPEADC